MRNSIIVLLLLALLSSCAGKSTEKVIVESAQIVDFGLLNIKIKKTIDRSTTASGKYNIADVESVKKTTDNIQLKKNETFGIIYNLTGQPQGRTVILNAKLTHPPIKNSTVSTAKVWAKIGENNNSFYTFNEDYELVEGEWIFQIFYKDKLLVEKSFEVKK